MTVRKPKSSFETDARLAALVNSIGHVYYVVDRQWRVVMFNDAAEAYFGRPRDEIQGRSLWDLYPKGRKSPFTSYLERAMNQGEPGRLVKASQVRSDRIVDFRVAPLGEDGVGVSLVDVTERVQAEEAMRESRERLDLAVGAHNIGIFDWHVPSGRIVWSRELEMIFGLEPGVFKGTAEDFQSRVSPEDLPRAQAETQAALSEGRDLIDFNFRIRRADGEIRWIEGVARVVYDADRNPQRIVGTNFDVTERKMAEQHQRLLINELNHRVKNTLAIVQAIAWQSFRSGGMAKAAREAFEGRLAALAAAHDVLNRRNWEGASIAQIVAEAVAPQDPGDGRLTVSGPSVTLEPKTAVALALATHELATNAVKYGALSTPDGRVDVRWTTDGGMLRLTWCETGGPPVEGPIQRGFGARLLEQGLAEELKGSVQIEFRREGVVCSVEARLAA